MAKKKKKSKTVGERVDAAYSGCFDDKAHSDEAEDEDEEESESPTSKGSDKKSDKKDDDKDADSENDASECEEGEEDLYNLPSKKKMKKATKHWILENPGWAAVIAVILLCILCRCAKSLCKRIKRCLVLLFPCCCKRKPAKKVVRRNTQHNIGPKLKSSKNEWGFDHEQQPLLPGGTPKSAGRKSFFGFLHPKVRAKQVLEQRKKEEKLAKLKRAKSLSKLSTGSSNPSKSSKSSDSRRSKSVSGRKSISGRKSVTSSKISNDSKRSDRIVVSGKQTIASMDSNVVPRKKVSAPSVSIKKASTQEALKEYKERKAKKDKKINRKRSASSSSSSSSSSDSEDDARKSSSKNSKLSTNFTQKSAEMSKNSFYKKRTTSAAIDGLSKLNLGANSSEASRQSDQKVFLEDALNEDIVTPVHGRNVNSSRISKEKEHNVAIDSKTSGHSRLSKDSKNFIHEFDFTSAQNANTTIKTSSSDRRKSVVGEKQREKSVKKSSTRSNLNSKDETSAKTSSKTSSPSRRKSVKYESVKETNSSNSSSKKSNSSEKSSTSSSRRKSVAKSSSSQPKKSSSGELRPKKRDQRR